MTVKSVTKALQSYKKENRKKDKCTLILDMLSICTPKGIMIFHAKYLKKRYNNYTRERTLKKLQLLTSLKIMN